MRIDDLVAQIKREADRYPGVYRRLEITTTMGELEKLLEVCEAALAWRDHPVHCRDDAYDRDEAFAEVIEVIERIANKVPA